MTRQKGDYSQIWEWVYNNFNIQGYFSAQDLINDVRQEFERTKSFFPEQAEELIRYRFGFRSEYAQMQAKQDEAKEIAELIGSGQVLESLSDEILDDLRSPKAEIMDIDMTEYATTKETVIPPDIIRFAERQTFFGRVASGFRRLLRFGRK